MSLIHLHLLSVGIATVGSVWQKISSFLLLLMVFSFAPHGLNVAHRLPLDKTVFIIEVAQITQKNLGCSVVLSLWHWTKGMCQVGVWPSNLKEVVRKNSTTAGEKNIKKKPHPPFYIACVLQGWAVNPVPLGDLQRRAVLWLLSG